MHTMIIPPSVPPTIASTGVDSEFEPLSLSGPGNDRGVYMMFPPGVVDVAEDANTKKRSLPPRILPFLHIVSVNQNNTSSGSVFTYDAGLMPLKL
jgi:hypothetical protein